MFGERFESVIIWLQVIVPWMRLCDLDKVRTHQTSNGGNCHHNRWPDMPTRHLDVRVTRPELTGDAQSLDDGVMSKQMRYSPKARERAVPIVFHHLGEHASQGAALSSPTSLRAQ